LDKLWTIPVLGRSVLDFYAYQAEEQVRKPMNTKKKRRVLFVDDMSERWEIFNELYRTPETAHVEFVWAKNYDEAIAQLPKGKWDVVFLDHDLEDPTEYNQQSGWRDGTAIVDWIREHTPFIGNAICHSMNPVGRMRMVQILQRGNYPARPVPFYSFDGFLLSLIADGDDSQIPQTDKVWEEEIGDLYGG